jgi:hypothetical protein
MAKDTEPPFTWTGWGLKEAANQATAVCTYLQNLSQAADVNDRVKVHTEFVHNQMQMFNDRAKAMSEAVAKASDFMGVFVSLLQRRKQFEDMVRNSPTYGAGGDETKRGGEGRGT